MSATFSRTLRSLRAERGRTAIAIIIVSMAVLVGWVIWLSLGQVAIYEVSPEARLEVRGGVHPVSPLVSGRVSRLEVSLGQEVAAGDVLFALDDRAQQLALAEGQARLADLNARIEALGSQISAEEAAVEGDREAVEAAVAEARAWRREADTREDRAEEIVDRQRSLHDRGLATGEELREAEAVLAVAEAEVRARREQENRVEQEGAVRIQDRLSRVAQLQSQRVELEGMAAVEAVSVERLRHEIEGLQVRAPVGGRVGELAEVRIGSVVEPGLRLAEIIPEGELHVVALFSIESAGRFALGQPARLRFPGYSWTQFGTVRAQVAAVGQEPVDGQIRLELSLVGAESTPIPIEHSLPVIVEVEVDRVSPLELFLRTAGKRVEGND